MRFRPARNDPDEGSGHRAIKHRAADQSHDPTLLRLAITFIRTIQKYDPSLGVELDAVLDQ